jgi:hypothetical protein
LAARIITQPPRPFDHSACRRYYKARIQAAADDVNSSHDDAVPDDNLPPDEIKRMNAGVVAAKSTDRRHHQQLMRY